MAEVLETELIEAGVHFGPSRRNPKMAAYSYARKNLRHIIDIRETVRGLLRAQKYLNQVVARGGLILFVGTKRQAWETIEHEASRCRMPFVSERWLGGTLTNFRAIRNRLSRLEELEELRSGEGMDKYSKKMQSSLNREYRKMYRNLKGLQTMNRLPECVVVVDPKREKNAVSEARELGITTVALLGMDCDPDAVDLPIPGNDDGSRSIEIVIRHIADAIAHGMTSVTNSLHDALPSAASLESMVVSDREFNFHDATQDIRRASQNQSDLSAASDCWTVEKNRRRCELIDIELGGTISAEERQELARLTAEVDEHLRSILHPADTVLQSLENQLKRKVDTKS
jgi:small subunit ribosomal protein S2